MIVAKRFTVVGRVQGVGFRWSAQEEARRLNLVGWVQNEDDGSVAGFVQGEAASVEQFAAWLRQGPPSARVDRIHLDDAVPAGVRIFTAR